MHKDYLHIAGIETETQAQQLKSRLKRMIGVLAVEINVTQGQVYVEYETPTNLDSLEKEIYDAGYKIIV